jgi:hypothetical protein
VVINSKIHITLNSHTFRKNSKKGLNGKPRRILNTEK